MRETKRILSIHVLAFILLANQAVFADSTTNPTNPINTIKVTNATTAEEQKRELKIEDKLNKKISLDLRDMSILDVLKFMAMKGDFNIVTSKGVEGRINLLLNNVTIKDALEIILIANSLAYTLKNNIVYVMSEPEYQLMHGRKFNDNSRLKIVYLKYARPSYILSALQNIRSNIGKIVLDEDTGTVVMIDTPEKIIEMEDAIKEMEHKTETKVINLHYAKAEALVNQLKEKVDAKAVGTISFDARSNQIILTALPERMKEIQILVSALDVKPRAVLLEAKILQVTLKPQYDTGINWKTAFSRSTSSVIKGLNFTGAFPVSTDISSTVGDIAVGGRLDENQFSVELKALKQVSTTKLLANPKIMAFNNQEAKIHIGDTIPYVTTTTTGTGDTATTSETVTFLNIGIQLLVTPNISDNGLISIKIKPEISSKTGDYTTPKNAKIPIVNTTLVDTTVMVKDGNTIIIGGLVKNDKLIVRKGIPGIMDIPLVGSLFSSKSDIITNSEIVILLTPRIVTGDTETGESSTEIKGIKDYETK